MIVFRKQTRQLVTLVAITCDYLTCYLIAVNLEFPQCFYDVVLDQP